MCFPVGNPLLSLEPRQAEALGHRLAPRGRPPTSWRTIARRMGIKHQSARKLAIRGWAALERAGYADAALRTRIFPGN